jgi:FkbM family methyltransferase
VTSQHASLIYRGDSGYESGETEEVDILTLEELLDGLQIDEVDMAKMDCEGAEVEAILATSDQTLRRIKHHALPKFLSFASIHWALGVVTRQAVQLQYLA